MTWALGDHTIGRFGLDEVGTSFWDQQAAVFDQSVLDTPTFSLRRIWEMGQAEETPGPVLKADEARKRAESEGIRLELGNEPINEAVFDIMLRRARERRIRDSVIARGPQGAFATLGSFGTALAAQIWDPINIASAFIPVLGQARYAQMLAGAGGVVGRAGVRVGVGAAEGLVGQAVVEPFTLAANTQEGQDYGMADVLRNIAFGAAIGAALHPPVGAVFDWRAERAAARDLLRQQGMEAFEKVWLRSMPEPSSLVSDTAISRGVELEPFSLGSQYIRRTGEEGAKPRYATFNSIFERLPPEARADALRMAMADAIQGIAPRTDVGLQMAAAKDPEIRQAIAPPLARSEHEVQVSGDNISLVAADGKAAKELRLQEDATDPSALTLNGAFDLKDASNADKDAILMAAALRSLDQGKPLASGQIVDRGVAESIQRLVRDTGLEVRWARPLRVERDRVISQNADVFLITSRGKSLAPLARELDEARQFNQDVATAPTRATEAPTRTPEPEARAEPTKPSEDLVLATENFRAMRESGLIDERIETSVKAEMEQIDEGVKLHQAMYKAAASCVVKNYG